MKLSFRTPLYFGLIILVVSAPVLFLIQTKMLPLIMDTDFYLARGMDLHFAIKDGVASVFQYFFGSKGNRPTIDGPVTGLFLFLPLDLEMIIFIRGFSLHLIWALIYFIKFSGRDVRGVMVVFVSLSLPFALNLLGGIFGETQGMLSFSLSIFFMDSYLRQQRPNDLFGGVICSLLMMLSRPVEWILYSVPVLILFIWSLWRKGIFPIRAIVNWVTLSIGAIIYLRWAVFGWWSVTIGGIALLAIPWGFKGVRKEIAAGFILSVLIPFIFWFHDFNSFFDYISFCAFDLGRGQDSFWDYFSYYGLLPTCYIFCCTAFFCWKKAGEFLTNCLVVTAVMIGFHFVISSYSENSSLKYLVIGVFTSYFLSNHLLSKFVTKFFSSIIFLGALGYFTFFDSVIEGKNVYLRRLYVGGAYFTPQRIEGWKNFVTDLTPVGNRRIWNILGYPSPNYFYPYATNIYFYSQLERNQVENSAVAPVLDDSLKSISESYDLILGPIEAGPATGHEALFKEAQKCLKKDGSDCPIPGVWKKLSLGDSKNSQTYFLWRSGRE